MLLASLAAAPSWARMLVCGTDFEASTPYFSLDDLCRQKRWTCVADLSSQSNPCVPGYHVPYPGGPPIPRTLEDLASKCPSYAWRIVRGVHVFAPKNPADSPLSVTIISTQTAEVSGNEALGWITYWAKLPGPGSGESACAQNEWRTYPIRKTRFHTDRGPALDAIVAAARHLKPSYWVVICEYGHCKSYVDDYNDLLFKGTKMVFPAVHHRTTRRR